MRYLLACLAILSVVSATGCQERQNMRTVPSRELRAGGDDSRLLGDNGNKPVANKDEHYYTIEAGDTIYTIAKKFNTTPRWLIHRNEIEDASTIKPGENMIVPNSK
jgi:LysM repeat protein